MIPGADEGQRVHGTIMEIDTQPAVELLSQYFRREDQGKRRLTGSAFDAPNVWSCPYEITAEDLIAASYLAVPISGKAALHILEHHPADIKALLRQIPVDKDIADADHDETFGETSPLMELWRLLRGTTHRVNVDLGPVRVSKILARKRPWLVPIQDSVVMGWLDVSDRDFWRAWWHAMRVGADSSSEETLSAWAERLRTKTIREADKTGLSSEAVGEIERLSHLRLLDIVIWMEGKQENPSTDVVDESSS